MLTHNEFQIIQKRKEESTSIFEFLDSQEFRNMRYRIETLLDIID
jgi:hypothetical protein